MVSFDFLLPVFFLGLLSGDLFVPLFISLNETNMLCMIAGEFVIDTPQKLKCKLEMVILVLVSFFLIFFHIFLFAMPDRYVCF